MAIQRAVIAGLLAGTVQTRNIFTADVVTLGGDTPQQLWNAYLGPIYTALSPAISPVWTSSTIELQDWTLGHWVPFDLYTVTWTMTGSGDILPNIVAIVLLGKAAGLRHVGRKFFSGVTEGATLANSLTTAALAMAASALAAYLTPVTGVGGGTLTPGVLDKGGFFHAFVGGQVSSLLGSMRRRKPGLGI